MKRVIIDANIAWRMLSRGRADIIQLFGAIGVDEGVSFHAPRFLFVELFKHKERLLRASKLSESQLLKGLEAFIARIEFHDESLLPLGTWLEAFRLTSPTDQDDTPYVALALHLDADLWTEDAKLRVGLKTRGFDRFFSP